MARYYSNRYGRFTSVDPGHRNANLAYPQTWNAYGYLEDDPVNGIDPTGEFSLKKLFKVISVVAAVAAAILAPPVGAALLSTTAVWSSAASVLGIMATGAAIAAAAAPEPAPTCDVQAFAAGIGGYSASDLNAATAVIMGEGTGLSYAGRYGRGNIADEYIAIGSVVFNRAELSGRSVTYEASQRTDSLGRLQFQGYTNGAQQMAALEAGNTNFFVPSNPVQRASDPHG